MHDPSTGLSCRWQRVGVTRAGSSPAYSLCIPSNVTSVQGIVNVTTACRLVEMVRCGLGDIIYICLFVVLG